MATADDFRAIALALPQAQERETWGHPTFRVGNKMFATLSDDGTRATAKASRDEQSALVGEDPETFSVPAYVGRHGWIGLDLTRVDPGHLAELLADAWRLTAPERLATSYDADRPA